MEALLQAAQHLARPASAADAIFFQSADARDAFADHLRCCLADGSLQRTLVLPDRQGKPLAACTLLVEPKFARGAASSAHLTRWDGGGQRMRAELLRQLADVARQEGCYKALLDAPLQEAPTLRACGFEVNCLTLVHDLDSSSLARRGKPGTSRPGGGDEVGVAASFAPQRLAGSTYTLRLLDASDAEDRYVSLLRQLTEAPSLDAAAFLRQLERVRRSGGMHSIFVVEEAAGPSAPGTTPLSPRPGVPQLMGCATLLLERMPVRSDRSSGRGSTGDGGEVCARIEDVVVDASTRGTGLGRKLIHALLRIAAESGASRASLNASESNEGFYAKCGFRRPAGGHVCFSRYVVIKGVASHSAGMDLASQSAL